MVDFPIEAVRGQFPALSLTDKGRRRIYLDNPAGTQVPQAVADAVSRCLLTTNANLGGYFETTIAAQSVVDDAHRAMADFLGAAGPALREPVGRMHWAGTETADVSMGYLDGAIQSGSGSPTPASSA